MVNKTIYILLLLQVLVTGPLYSATTNAVCNGTQTVFWTHGNGADASTTIVDQIGKTVTAVGNAQIDTAQSQFGGASILLDGTGDKLTLADSADWFFSTGNFTIDFWVRFNTALPGAGVSADFWYQYADENNLVALQYSGTSGIGFVVKVASSVIVSVSQGATTGWSADTWYHVALVRNGSAWNIYRNGTSIASATDTDAVGDIAGGVEIGHNPYPGNDYYLSGWLDEFRVVKGVAVWTANFTPRTNEYRKCGGVI